MAKSMCSDTEEVDYVGILLSLPIYILGLLVIGPKYTIGIFVFQMVIMPLVFKYSGLFRRSIIFANFVQWPMNIDWEEPKKYGVDGGRNLTIQFESKVAHREINIGVWHILPKSSYEKLKDKLNDQTDKEKLNKIMDDELATSQLPIIMYCHGNANNRAIMHRTLLYKFFQNLDFHTITFDYRGYGNSTHINPSEPGLVEDSLMVYEWLLNTAYKQGNTPPVIIWGHSLGTGISSALLGDLPNLSRAMLGRDPLPLPNALILEAPFNNLAEAVRHFPLSKLLCFLPYYDRICLTPFRYEKEHKFASDSNLAPLKSLPVLILHAKDDGIIPFKLGYQLYKTIASSRTKEDATIQFKGYEKDQNLGHKYICLAKDLPDVIGDFVKKHQVKNH